MDEAAGEAVDALLPRFHRVRARAAPTALEGAHVSAQRAAVGNDERCRGRGSRRAHVGGEIANREVGLVADARHDGNAGLEDRARHALFIEGPEILDRSAAARDDQHVDLAARACRADCARQIRRRSFALNHRGVEDHADAGPPMPQRGQNVGERRGARRGDDPDAPGKGRQRALALRGKPAGRAKARLETLELFVERADASQAHGLDVELKLSAGLENRRCGTDLDGKTVLERESGELRFLPEEYAAHLRRGILQIEIAVSGGGAGEVRDLSRNPAERQVPLQDEPRGAHEEADRDDRSPGWAVLVYGAGGSSDVERMLRRRWFHRSGSVVWFDIAHGEPELSWSKFRKTRSKGLVRQIQNAAQPAAPRTGDLLASH